MPIMIMSVAFHVKTNCLLQILQQNHQSRRQWGMALWPSRRELRPGGGAGGGARVQPRGDVHHHREGWPLCICFLPSRAGVCTPRGHKQNSARHTAGNQDNKSGVYQVNACYTAGNQDDKSGVYKVNAHYTEGNQENEWNLPSQCTLYGR